MQRMTYFESNLHVRSQDVHTHSLWWLTAFEGVAVDVAEVTYYLGAASEDVMNK